MIRSPATLTIANFNRQTLADLLRPVLDRAMTQGMVEDKCCPRDCR